VTVSGHQSEVAGGWHGAWAFERALPEDSANRHITLARDPPAHGLNAHAIKGFDFDPSPVAGTMLGGYVDSVAATIDHLAANGLGKIVLVGHSVGGLVLHAAGERIPDRIAKLVHLWPYAEILCAPCRLSTSSREQGRDTISAADGRHLGARCVARGSHGAWKQTGLLRRRRLR
jgi:hypothetical protein